MDFLDTISGIPSSPQKDRVLELQDIINRQLGLFVKLIDDFGAVKCVQKKPDEVVYDDLFHDFLFYGLTKSFKSFLATSILCENLYQEDAQILLRSTYETYLAINYVHNNPKELDHYTRKALGLSIGEIKHPLSKKGKLQKNKIVDPAIGVTEDFGLSISTLLTGIDSKDEIEMHKTIYPYLCEHTHLNMIASGNYREPNDKKYTYISFAGYEKPIIYLMYLLIVYFDFLTSKMGIENDVLPFRMQEENQVAKQTLMNFIKDFKTHEEEAVFIQHMLNRLALEKKVKEKNL